MKGHRMITIKENNIFKKAYNRGKKEVAFNLVLYYVPNRASTRLGITVSKKIGKAVVRNKIRRLVRESWRSFCVKEGFDVVIVARNAAASSNFASITKSLSELLEKSGLIEQ